MCYYSTTLSNHGSLKARVLCAITNVYPDYTHYCTIFPSVSSFLYFNKKIQNGLNHCTHVRCVELHNFLYLFCTSHCSWLRPCLNLGSVRLNLSACLSVRIYGVFSHNKTTSAEFNTSRTGPRL